MTRIEKGHIWVIALVLLFVTPALAQNPDLVQQAETQVSDLINTLWQRIDAVTDLDLVRAVLIIGGGLMLLIGWRIYNFIILLAGALTGAVFAAALVPPDNLVIVIVAMLIGAVLGSAIAAFLYYAAVFAIGAYIGALLTLQIVIALDLNIAGWAALIFGAIMGGLILLGLSFELLVILASIVGAQMIALGLGLNATWTIALIGIGILLQIMLARMLGYRIRRRPSRRMLFREA